MMMMLLITISRNAFVLFCFAVIATEEFLTFIPLRELLVPAVQCVMENGVDEKGHTAAKKTQESNAPLRNDVATDMEVETKDPVTNPDAEVRPDKEVESEVDVENRAMDVDNRDTDVENVEVNMVEDSASEEDDICTPPDAAMDVNVSCDDECAERIKKFVDLPRCESEYMTEEEDDPDDLYKPEGTIYLDIDGFSQFCKGSPETQQRLSKPVFVRGLPWKILAIPRDAARVSTGTRPNKALGFFLQCNGDSDAVAWNCIASASLKVLGQVEGFEDHSRRITHTFYPKENDWGYSQFLTCDHLINPENGFIKDDTIRLVVHVSADAPHGVQWDSKKTCRLYWAQKPGSNLLYEFHSTNFVFYYEIEKGSL
ncbi:hypothetical protein KIN20_006646 [Parelaphostrongylus tenuis]|uniref:MATH domain-containing protein n=1 Tax=Parelaphostrongylus tenuis TaxID=148309 RepID=A0AAD5M576_PARTN|nr:hypothetical protein KIN20_006646 [Parelaphostrongylus tenuis]